MALQVLIRLAVLLALDIALLTATHLVPGLDEQALGIGLVFFLAVAAIAMLWSFADSRARGLPRTVALWAVVGALLGVAMPLIVGATDGGPDWGVVWQDVVTFVPFMLVLVLVPSVVGAAIGRWGR